MGFFEIFFSVFGGLFFLYFIFAMTFPDKFEKVQAWNNRADAALKREFKKEFAEARRKSREKDEARRAYASRRKRRDHYHDGVGGAVVGGLAAASIIDDLSDDDPEDDGGEGI